jgi:uncharacterized membrane protein
VYRLFIDVERWPELTQSMRSVRRLDDGPIRVGSEATVSQPRLPSARWRVTELEPDRRFTWQTSAGGVTTVGDHLVEPDGAGSRITLVVSLRGPLSGVMGLLMGGIARRYAGMELEGFRVAADAEGPAESPGRAAPSAG